VKPALQLLLVLALAIATAFFVQAVGGSLEERARPSDPTELLNISVPRTVHAGDRYTMLGGFALGGEHFTTRVRVCPAEPAARCQEDIVRNHYGSANPYWATFGSLRLPQGKYEATLLVLSDTPAGPRTSFVYEWPIVAR
jgi:hypothetical protein